MTEREVGLGEEGMTEGRGRNGKRSDGYLHSEIHAQHFVSRHLFPGIHALKVETKIR